MRELSYSSMESPIGTLFLASSERGLAFVSRRDSERAFVREVNERAGIAPERNAKTLREAKDEMDAYFAGETTAFGSPLDLSLGTPFQQRVWRTLQRIPYGETRSYRWVAERLGSKGYRAVGGANNRNPVMIVVPCHRVVAEDGGLGGYACGLGVKRKLLSLEAARSKNGDRR